MGRLFRIALTICVTAALFCCMAVPAFASVQAPSGTIINNTTGVVGPLKYKLLDSAGQSFCNEWRGSSNNANCMISFDADYLYLCRFASSLSGQASVYDSTHIKFASGAPAYSFVQFDLRTGEPVKQDDGYNVGYYSPGGMQFSGNLIQYKAFLSAGISLSGYSKIWSWVETSPQGSFSFLWDDTTTPVDPPPEPEDSGVSDWLGNFWDTLVETIKGLFVPEDGYFEEWFQSLKDAFDRQVGGVGGLLEYIQQKFQALQNGQHRRTSLVITLPDNLLFPGFKGVSGNMLAGLDSMLTFLRNVLTAIVVILTAIAVIRKVIALVRN